MGLKVGDKRLRKGDKDYPFEILFIGKGRVFCRYVNVPDYQYEEFVECIFHIQEHSEAYQEPKPVRKLEAWETKVNGIAHGTIELCFSDSESSIYNKEHSNAYRKLSDQELKELIKGVIGD